jgi:hypothetical protein
MIDLKKIRRRDLEQISAYLDGELSENDARRVEARIQTDATLRWALQELQTTHKMIAGLPEVRPPRNFTLTPEMAGVRQRRNLYPVFRFATVIATAAFAVLVGADALTSGGFVATQEVPEAAKMALESEVDAEALAGVAVEEADGFEAPMEDAVIGAVGNETAEARPEFFAPESSPEPMEAAGTSRESGFPGFGTDTGGESLVEQTKVESTLAVDGTLAAEDEMDPMEDSSNLQEPPVAAAPTTINEVEPTAIIEVVPAPMLFEPQAQEPELNLLRIAEVGIGSLALISAILTWLLRRAR